jgi:hypothetical protein
MCHYKVPGQDMKILHRIAQDAGLKHIMTTARLGFIWYGWGLVSCSLQCQQTKVYIAAAVSEISMGPAIHAPLQPQFAR